VCASLNERSLIKGCFRVTRKYELYELFYIMVVCVLKVTLLKLAYCRLVVDLRCMIFGSPEN
jgi:hypothetical protein